MFSFDAVMTKITSPVSPAQTAWTAHDYPAYLTAVQSQFPQVTVKPQTSFSLIVTVAIALEQTHGWDGGTGQAVRDALAPSPDATRELQACWQLLAGDAEGLTRLFDGPPPYSRAFADPLLAGDEMFARYSCASSPRGTQDIRVRRGMFQTGAMH